MPCTVRTVWLVPPDVHHAIFDKQLKERLSDLNYIDASNESISYIQDIDISTDEPEVKMAIVANDFTDDTYDQYVGAELITVHQGEYHHAIVNKRLRDPRGDPIGKRHANPQLDT
jgi:hypothetical protein